MKRVIALTMLLVMLCFVPASALTLRTGSSGETVKQLQKKLQEQGYYTGSIDGIYGSATTAAVKAYQKTNGLAQDGIAGEKTLQAIGISSSGSGNVSSEVYLMAKAIYGEARGEEYLGKVAVGAVIINRVGDANFPNSISGVVYQPGAFDAVSDGQINLSPDEECIRAARDAYSGWDPTNGCLYYYNPATATNRWMLSKPVYLTVGKHVFCK